MTPKQASSYVDLIIDQIEQVKEMIEGFKSENPKATSYVQGAEGGLNASIQELRNAFGEL